MTVTITIQGENANEALQELAGLAKGMLPSALPVGGLSGPRCSTGPEVDGDPASKWPEAVTQCGLGATLGDTLPSAPGEANTAPQRERGKPSAGRARRTKEEIAEDDAADAADAAQTAETAAVPAEEAVQSNPVEEAQDAADEAADPVNAPASEATRDDVRAAMVEYSQKNGMPKLTADMSTLLGRLWPDGSVTKLSEIPEDAAAFASVIDGLKGMA